MKKVTSSEFIAIVKEAVRKVSEGSTTSSIRGQFSTVTYLCSSVLKNGYYAKNQANKDDKNPFWGRDIKAIKSYTFHIGADYAKQAEKDGKELTEVSEEENPYSSIVPNLIFRLKRTGDLYIQVMSKARDSKFYLDGEEMTAEDKATLDRYAKPYKGNGVSDDYKKLNLSKVQDITINGETYTIEDDVTIINLAETESLVVAESK